MHAPPARQPSAALCCATRIIFGHRRMNTARTRILDSARDAFTECGLIGASIADVSQASRASVGSIYHHFEGKEGLAGAVYVAALRDFQGVFASAVTRSRSPRDGIERGVRAVLRWCLRDQPDAARFLLTAADAERGAAEAELRDANREFFRIVLAWWDEGVAAGELRPLDLDLAHSIWLGPALEYCRLRLGDRTRVAPARAERELADAAWNALRTSEGDDS
jgi:AcrR family transcriptional regulator